MITIHEWTLLIVIDADSGSIAGPNFSGLVELRRIQK